MNDLPDNPRILKSLIAPARYSDGPTLYLICESADGKGCAIYELMPGGGCQLWPETLVGGPQQAECRIYQRPKD